MAEYAGKSLHVEFGGTDLSGDFRRMTTTESQNLADATAGSDTYRTYVSTVTDGSADVELVDQTDGSALWTAIAPGTEGTLIWAPYGTASGKAKYTVDAIVGDRGRELPYDDVVTTTATFQFSGTVAESVY